MRNSDWITTSLAQQRTGIPRRTIIAAITAGRLPAIKLPGVTGAYLIEPADLQQWADSRTRRAAL